jgi:hypothetical protein
MNISHFVTRSAAVVALASLVGCSSSSSTGSSGDYKASKNGCTVTVTGAFTLTDVACTNFSATSGGIVASLKDKPATGDSDVFTANMDSVAAGTYQTGSSSTEIFVMTFTVGGVTYGNATNVHPTNGTVQLDSSETPMAVTPSLKTFGGSYSADLYKQGDDATVVGHVVVKF